MTHRQFMAWQWWLAEQWNQPDRSDHYLMQLAAAQDAKEGPKHLNDYRLRFSVPSPAVKEEPAFLVDGKPFGPRRLTKEDVERLERMNLMARIASVKSPDRSKQTQAEMSRQIDEMMRHNERAKQDKGNHRVSPNGIKPAE